ncbi:ABC transporter ATP-binding protein [Pseudonocardia nigra]|uniref:ABC transporter ATP-binding protein n=1 Tax=Pseudonocardia nigra TaxID=1921578 RepID=UPI001C5F477F|nr:ABC transporter ATP-binding protein [Pseudonocardia nigra]
MTTDLLPVASAARTRAAVGELLRPHRFLAVAALAGLAASAGVGLLAAPLLGRIVDLVAQDRPAAAVTLPALLLAGVAIAQGLLAVAGTALTARLGEGVLARLRERFVAHAMALPLERIERAGAGDLTARVTVDVTVIADAVRRALPEFARSVLVIALTLVGLAVLDWRFLLAALCAVPVQVVTARWYLRRSTPLYTQQRVTTGTQQQQLLDTIGGAATVRAFGLADDHVARLGRRAQDVVDLAMRVVGLQTRFFGRLNHAEFIGVTAVLTTGFFLVRADAVTIGTASAAALYFINLFTPVNQALFLLDTAQSAAASLARLVGVVDLPPEAEPAHPAAPRDASVSVTGVGHAYRPGQDVLDGVDLAIAPGTRVALVGASGAGKTTLATIVAGVHRPSRGTVRLGGATLAELGPARIRRTAALVTQEVHVFAGPLADDLRLARPGASDAELRDALAAVGALGWAEALPDGLATVVGDGGHALTVVQAQQLALARLVLADPPIAILDEATAEAGSAGSRVLDAAARRALEGRTALVVAHRLGQAATADRVVVLDAGRVVEHGTHDELVAAGGRYAQLWAAWAQAPHHRVP